MDSVRSNQSQKILKNFFIIILGSLILTISAKIKIPFYPVPMTMQTFVVLLLGVSLGWKLGLFTVSLYLIQGIAGLPVFAGTPEKGAGIVYFTGPTMGYLVGFLIAVYLAGFFKYTNNFFKNLIKLIFSVSFIYLLGMIWLGILIGWDKPVFKLGAQPFLLAELFKVVLLALIIPALFKFKKS